MSHAAKIGFNGWTTSLRIGPIMAAGALANCSGPACAGEEELRCRPRKSGTVRGRRRDLCAARPPGPALEPVKPARAMPAGQGKPGKWPARISMTASRDMKRDLELARLEEGLESPPASGADPRHHDG